MTPADRIARLFGFAEGRRVVVVTPRGVCLPLTYSQGWTVVEISELLAEIDRLPEVRR